MKKFVKMLCFLMIVVLGVICLGCVEKHKLTVHDSDDYIIENLKKSYIAGEKITVKTAILMDVDLLLYIDGEFVCRQTAIEMNGSYTHWEFYFVMPNHDAILSFKMNDDMRVILDN